MPWREKYVLRWMRLLLRDIRAGFMLYDLNSGGGISYHADEMYYSASAIKGPYVAWLVEDYPQTMDFLYGTIKYDHMVKQ